jgi:thiamine biosynthesis lipoprotein
MVDAGDSVSQGSGLRGAGIVRRARPLLGTLVEIAVAAESSPTTETAIDAAFDAVARVQALMSFHDPQSDVSQLNRAADASAIAIHAWTFEVLAAAVELHRRSDGLFNVAVAPALQASGLLPGMPDGLQPIEDAIEPLPERRVRFRCPGVRIDLGGIAKGFAVDRAVGVLRAQGVAAGLVNAGGDLMGFGPNAHAIHIRDPSDPAGVTARVEVRNQALASSAGRFDPFCGRDVEDCAIIDPRSREPVRMIRGASVRAPSCMIADALTKVVMIAQEDTGPLLDHYRASALFVSSTGEVRATADWQDVASAADLKFLQHLQQAHEGTSNRKAALESYVC